MPTAATTLQSLVRAAKNRTDWGGLYGKRLAIVVPYRNRSEHLAAFLPHILAYFDRDKLDSGIAFEVHIVEQSDDGRPFNSGTLKNVGYHLTKDRHDYVCFHDVDYLPVWADYSYPNTPARLIWHGLRLQENYDDFFGAVVMFNRSDFQKVNGYSNRYPGWGFEDIDLRIRCIVAGLGIEHRDGTYESLPHADRGHRSDGTLTEEAMKNAALFNANMAEFKRTRMLPDDGLSDLEFKLDSSDAIGAKVWRHRVTITHSS
jgi:hypothetical protein